MPYAPINFTPQTVNAYGSTMQNPEEEAYFDRLRNSPLGKALGPKLQEKDRQQKLDSAAASAGGFADQGQAGYGNMTNSLATQRKFYEDLMGGRGNSVVNEQLRQGLLQQQAAQQSLAAGASPQNSSMAARSAMMNMGRAQAQMSGQAALARLQEQQMAAEQLSNLNLGQRGQDINVGLGSRQNQMTGLGANKTEQKGPSNWEKAAGIAAIGAGLFSDERLKTDVKSGDAAAKRALDVLSAHTYRYKDPKHGEGTQLGVMAQALERAGLKQAVVDTPVGKAVDTAKLTGANTSMLAALAKRVTRMERSKK